MAFEDVVSGENITFISDEYLKTPLSEKYGENAYACIFYISGEDIPPGMWSYRFEAKDNGGILVPTLYGQVRFWMIGSLLSMWNAFRTNINAGGFIPLGLITASIPMMGNYPYISIAISMMATLGGLIFEAQKQQDYCKKGNLGGLFGQSLALMFTSFTMSFTVVRGFMSKINIKIFDIADKLSIWTKFYLYITMFQAFLTFIPIEFGRRSDIEEYGTQTGFDLSILYNILYYPTEIIAIFVLGTMGKFLYSHFSSGLDNKIGAVAVSTCQMMYAAGTLIFSLVGFLIFYLQTHGFGVFYK